MEDFEKIAKTDYVKSQEKSVQTRESWGKHRFNYKAGMHRRHLMDKLTDNKKDSFKFKEQTKRDYQMKGNSMNTKTSDRLQNVMHKLKNSSVETKLEECVRNVIACQNLLLSSLLQGVDTCTELGEQQTVELLQKEIEILTTSMASIQAILEVNNLDRLEQQAEGVEEATEILYATETSDKHNVTINVKWETKDGVKSFTAEADGYTVQGSSFQEAIKKLKNIFNQNGLDLEIKTKFK